MTQQEGGTIPGNAGQRLATTSHRKITVSPCFFVPEATSSKEFETGVVHTVAFSLKPGTHNPAGPPQIAFDHGPWTTADKPLTTWSQAPSQSEIRSFSLVVLFLQNSFLRTSYKGLE
jgi:hypothetical protein